MKLHLKSFGLDTDIELEEIKITDEFTLQQLNALTPFPIKEAFITEVECSLFLVADMRIPKSQRYCVSDSAVFEITSASMD